MQIDFHHTVTYVVARLAGFKASEAQTIAYAAQYVDDATQDGTVRFEQPGQTLSFSVGKEDVGFVVTRGGELLDEVISSGRSLIMAMLDEGTEARSGKSHKADQA